jgi:Ca-activated chloride channel family protein
MPQDERTMNDWEAKLDARLRQVSLPAGLVARLQDIATHEPSLSDEELALLSDDALDTQLCAVELPASLIDRVQHDIAGVAAGEQIDALLVAVDVPRSLLTQLRMIPWQLTGRRQVQRMAMAAALLVTVSVGYYSLLGAWLSILRPQDTQEVAWIELNHSPLTIQSGVAEAATIASDDHPEMTTTELREIDEDLARVYAFTPELPVEAGPLPSAVGPTRDIETQFATTMPWHDVLVMRWGVLGSPSDVNDRLPLLESLPPLRATGLMPPLVRGFDRGFLLSRGAHPIVAPESHAELRSTFIPLTTSTESFRLAWQRLREGRMPDAHELHVADFIAAMDYPLPATPPGEIGLRTAAGPSPFGANGARMLQICVQAGPLKETERRPVHLTVALDVSASMNLGGKLEIAKRSLRQMLKQLGERDCVSLLLFNDHEQAEVVAVTRDRLPEVLRLVDALTGSGGTNIAAGIQRGASLAMSEGVQAGAERKLVLVTDGRAPLAEATHVALTELMTALKQEGLSWTVLDLSTDSQPDLDLARLAKATQGKLSHAASGGDAQWLLTDLLVGHPTIVAPDATLRVTFDPQAVAGYRLIGHEPSQLAGLVPASVSLDLRAGQVATGLLEVWLKPNAHENVAVAELTWRDPKTGTQHRQEQAISRLQFVPTFAEAPLSLQAAVIAAETGEILKESPFAESRNRSLADVRSLAFKVNSRLSDRESFRQFVSFLEAYERLRVDRITPR